jgi:hypothetical protein
MMTKVFVSSIVRFRTILPAIVVPMAMAVHASPVRAQAYLPPKGEGSVSVMFQDMGVTYHFLPAIPVDRGHIRGESLFVDVTYGLTDKVAVSIGIPWIASKYTGLTPHPLVDSSGPIPVFYGASPLDDGTYHGTFQDFRFDVRYNVTKRGLVLTPFAGSIMPSHDYTYFAHAAPGRDLRELQVGVLAAKMLDVLVPGLFVQSRYAYGFTEKALDISHNRSNMDLEVGYFLTPKLRLLGLGTAQLTHGGVDLSLNSRVDLGPLLWSHHDQIDRVNYLNLGGGMAYSLTQTVDIFGSLIRNVAQRNGHALDHGLSLGLSWSFSTAPAGDRAIASAEHSLVRCACEKGTR